MAEKSIHNPHDKLFKTTFAEPSNATGFLRGELPASLAAAFDWDRLRLEPGSFIDSHYRHSESDLLFSAQLHGQDGLIYVLFEHQREFDQWLALRLLRYMLRIWHDPVWDEALMSRLPRKILEFIIRYILEAGVDKDALDR